MKKLNSKLFKDNELSKKQEEVIIGGGEYTGQSRDTNSSSGSDVGFATYDENGAYTGIDVAETGAPMDTPTR